MAETKRMLSILLLLTLVKTCVAPVRAIKTCATYEINSQPTLCHKLELYSDKTNEYSILNAIGALKLKNILFPLLNDFWNALIAFDEPLYPIPLGPSIYFCFCIAILFCYIMTKAIRTYFEPVRKKMLLHPQTAKLPVLPLYWLQQSKREQSCKREVRNTWAWLAKKFMLTPNDPLLDGIDEAMNNTTWEDFQIPRDTWSLINVILKLNDLYVDHHEDHDVLDEKSQRFKIVKGRTTAGVQHQSFSNIPRKFLPEDLKQEGKPDEKKDANTLTKSKRNSKLVNRPKPASAPELTTITEEKPPPPKVITEEPHAEPSVSSQPPTTKPEPDLPPVRKAGSLLNKEKHKPREKKRRPSKGPAPIRHSSVDEGEPQPEATFKPKKRKKKKRLPSKDVEVSESLPVIHHEYVINYKTEKRKKEKAAKRKKRVDKQDKAIKRAQKDVPTQTHVMEAQPQKPVVEHVENLRMTPEAKERNQTTKKPVPKATMTETEHAPLPEKHVAKIVEANPGPRTVENEAKTTTLPSRKTKKHKPINKIDANIEAKKDVPTQTHVENPRMTPETKDKNKTTKKPPEKHAAKIFEANQGPRTVENETQTTTMEDNKHKQSNKIVGNRLSATSMHSLLPPIKKPKRMSKAHPQNPNPAPEEQYENQPLQKYNQGVEQAKKSLLPLEKNKKIRAKKLFIPEPVMTKEQGEGTSTGHLENNAPTRERKSKGYNLHVISEKKEPNPRRLRSPPSPPKLTTQSDTVTKGPQQGLKGKGGSPQNQVGLADVSKKLPNSKQDPQRQDVKRGEIVLKVQEPTPSQVFQYPKRHRQPKKHWI